MAKLTSGSSTRPTLTLTHAKTFFLLPLTGHKRYDLTLQWYPLQGIPPLFFFQFWTNTDFLLYRMNLEKKSLGVYGTFWKFIKGEPPEKPR